MRECYDTIHSTPGNFTFSIVCNRTGKAVGTFSYLSIRASMGVLEIGSILFSPSMQRRAIGTEAIFLITDYAVNQLNYRRIEWKCNSLNKPSYNAALRYGYKFEGIFRQHMIVRGVNRDSAWFSILDCEWKHELEGAYREWLSNENFGPDGQQLNTLHSFITKRRSSFK